MAFFFAYTKRTGVSSDEGPLNKFLRSPNTLEEIRKRLLKTNVSRIYNHISNSNLFDMGLEQEDLQNMALIKTYIDKMEEEFDLVMIADYFDESLILLKRLLCWKFEDIVYVKLRVKKKKKKLEFEEEVKKNILTWNRADVTLFHHFNKTFWRKVQQEGPSFYEDLIAFRKINQDIIKECASPSNIRAEHASYRRLLHVIYLKSCGGDEETLITVRAVDPIQVTLQNTVS